MSNITRKAFLGSLAAVASAAAIEPMKRDGNDGKLDDIYDDMYYVLQGGPYNDTGGVGAPGASWRRDLMQLLHNEDYHLMLDRSMDYVESNGFYFMVSLYTQHSHDEWVAYGHKKIPLTKEWLANFYSKHKIIQ